MVNVKNFVYNNEVQDGSITEEEETIYYCNIGYFTYITYKKFKDFNIEGNIMHFYYILGWCVVNGYYN